MYNQCNATSHHARRGSKVNFCSENLTELLLFSCFKKQFECALSVVYNIVLFWLIRETKRAPLQQLHWPVKNVRLIQCTKQSYQRRIARVGTEWDRNCGRLTYNEGVTEFWYSSWWRQMIHSALYTRRLFKSKLKRHFIDPYDACFKIWNWEQNSTLDLQSGSFGHNNKYRRNAAAWVAHKLLDWLKSLKKLCVLLWGTCLRRRWKKNVLLTRQHTTDLSR